MKFLPIFPQYDSSESLKDFLLVIVREIENQTKRA